MTGGWSSPLVYAVCNFLEDGVKQLVSQGADVNEPSSSGYVALHFSVKSDESVGITKILLDAGAFVNWQNRYGRTPLHQALRHCSLKNVKLLLRHNANLELIDCISQSPLEWAIYNLEPRKPYVKYKILEEVLDWGVNIYKVLLKRIFNSYDNYRVQRAMRIISMHLLKCKCANLPYKELYFITKFKLGAYEKSCLEELERMKSLRINDHTLHCVFSTCVSIYSNSLIESIVLSPDLETNFPIYASLLEATFIKYRKRHQLLYSAVNILSNLFSTNNIFVPEVIVRKILTYMNNKDISDIIKEFSYLIEK